LLGGSSPIVAVAGSEMVDGARRKRFRLRSGWQALLRRFEIGGRAWGRMPVRGAEACDSAGLEGRARARRRQGFRKIFI
jgi:hypothetical protein